MRLTDPDPIPELKRNAAAALVELMKDWNAYEVAVLMGTDEPRVSDIRRGKLQRFSLEMLIRYLTRLRRRVTLQIAEAPPPPRGTSARPRRG